MPAIRPVFANPVTYVSSLAHARLSTARESGTCEANMYVYKYSVDILFIVYDKG